jgi:hypothetical protein
MNELAQFSQNSVIDRTGVSCGWQKAAPIGSPCRKPRSRAWRHDFT